MGCLLGIDVGTTGTKSSLFTLDGNLIDLEYRSYPIFYPREGWAEQKADDWWNALVETVNIIISRNNCSRDVLSMCVSTQGGSLVLLDDSFKPICNAVTWMDTRAGEISDKLTEEISVKELYHLCGWPIVDGLNFPNIFWFREKRPGLFKKARYFSSTVDYINQLLTGRFAIDYTNLSIDGFFDIKKRDFSERVIGIAGITKDNLAEIVPSGKTIGKITRKAANTLGLTGDVLVVSGAHDQYCASIGAGAVEVGDCILSAGTAWVLLATCDNLYFNNEIDDSKGITRSVFPGLHPVEGKYGLMTSVPYGGNSLNWFRDIIRSDVSYKTLNEEAREVKAGSENLLFFPLSSSRRGKGAFLGIEAIHTMKHFTRSVFEGVVFLNRIQLELIQRTGADVKRLIMIGGGSKSEVWPQIEADVCNIPLRIPEVKESACAGAAILAGVGKGIFSSIEEASKRFIRFKEQIEPQKNNVEVYESLYRDFVDFFHFI